MNLRTAGNYVILTQAGIAGTTSTITGDLGVSPAAASYITGFSLAADASNQFSTSVHVTGRVYAADYVAPTPATLTTAISDLQLAYSDASARAPDVSELGAGQLGGLIVTPGVYRWSTGVAITTDVTLDGGPADVWIFEVAKDLSLSGGVRVVLTSGAVAKNVFWVVAGAVIAGMAARALHCLGACRPSSSST